jgi:hypothetical protein
VVEFSGNPRCSQMRRSGILQNGLDQWNRCCT